MSGLIPNDLCTRCGACFAADTSSILTKDKKGFPVYNSDDLEYKSRLLNVCSGENWNYKQLLKQQYGEDVTYDPASPDIGVYRKIYLLSSADEVSRNEGQSGGVTTTLLRYAFDVGLIQSALAVKRPNVEEGSPYAAMPYIAANKDELEASYGSKYTICSSLELIKDLENKEGGFAATLLPCQTVGLRRLMNEENSPLKEKCKLIIGPYCGLNLESEVGSVLAQTLGVDNDDVQSFKNRGGVFPGKTTLELKSGELKYVDRTAHRILYRMYSPLRCYTCTDYGNELADISVADCWSSKDGDFTHPEGAAYVVCRSARGEEVVRQAIESGCFQVHSCDFEVALERWKASFYHRKVRAHNRIQYWEKRRRPVPKPDYEIPPEFKESRLADSIEMGVWRMFRYAWLRRKGISLWLWLAKGPLGSFRNLFFEDCKLYLFTHRYDQFTKNNYKNSVRKYLRRIKRLIIK